MRKSRVIWCSWIELAAMVPGLKHANALGRSFAGSRFESAYRPCLDQQFGLPDPRTRAHVEAQLRRQFSAARVSFGTI
jgi:hypothetical protein